METKGKAGFPKPGFLEIAILNAREVVVVLKEFQPSHKPFFMTPTFVNIVCLLF